VQSERRQFGFNLLELVISLGIILVLLAVLIPALSSARAHSHRLTCAARERHLGSAWELYLADHDDRFPFVPIQPGWHYGGVRFSAVTGQSFLDSQRPLNPYVGAAAVGESGHALFRCPADCGIRHQLEAVGTGGRTAYSSFGTSFRINAALVDARIGGVADEPRGLHRHEITTAPSRMLLLGDPLWYETYEQTGRDADWHADGGSSNLLFMDGSVRFLPILPRGQRGPVVAEPQMGKAAGAQKPDTP
jgi:prepilin-type processing-associated H-X9-DG protein